MIYQDRQVELSACTVMKERIPHMILIFTKCPMKFKRYIIMREQTSLTRRHVVSYSVPRSQRTSFITVLLGFWEWIAPGRHCVTRK